MFEKDDPLDEMLEEIAKVLKIKSTVPGDYRHGRVLMLEAAEQMDTNVPWALRTMRKARKSFEEESEIAKRYNTFTAKWAKMDPYHFGSEEKQLERRLYQLLREGEFEQCADVLRQLEQLVDMDVAENIEIGLLLEVVNPEVHLGKGTTLSVLIHNHSAFPIKLDSLKGSSPQASVHVLDFYKGVMKKDEDHKCQINVIPKVEGDIVVEVQVDVCNDSRRMRIQKGFSLRVNAPAQVVQFVDARTPTEVQYVRTDMPMPAMKAPSSFDPLELTASGTVDQWASCVSVFARNKSPIDLSGLAAKDPNYVKADGYANLFRALLAMRFDPGIDWPSWFSEAGFTGEDYTKRCAKLLWQIGSSKERSVELEMDGSVGSSNIENLIGAMQIASGEVKRAERSRKTWNVEGEMDGSPFSLKVERTVRKDEKGKAVASSFRIVSG
ncbi:MAG: hypothetical protein A4E30_00908 [Methanomassiliicoccales archaeon PtaB.Bin215]|nr:MAG: hypothetical protein A4E30_00908 [Methanomassiliicoccales archaeon PtaB.Bin215]